MILNVEVNGYRFFEDNTEISFAADARTKKLLSNSKLIDGKNVLKSIGLYGANNSGKTNIATLFNLIKSVLQGRENVLFNSQLFDDSEKTSISITFNSENGNGWQNYHFIYNNNKKIYEYECLSNLKYYDSNKLNKSIVFEKNLYEQRLTILGEDKSIFLQIIPSRLPFIHSIELEGRDFNSLKEYYNEFIKLSNSIVVVPMYNIPIENTIEALKTDNACKIDFIKKFVKQADISVDDFSFDNDLKINLDNLKINENVLIPFTKFVDNLKLVTTYNQKKVPSLLFDSTGTKKIEAIASYIYDALVDGKTLIIDEIDNGLHYKLTRSIVALFNNIINNKGQLFFITHDLLLIDCNKLMRKDQIYFIRRNDKKAELYCLKQATSNDGGPREVSEIVKRYNRGDFGDIPNPDFIDLLIGVSLNG